MKINLKIFNKRVYYRRTRNWLMNKTLQIMDYMLINHQYAMIAMMKKFLLNREWNKY